MWKEPEKDGNKTVTWENQVSEVIADSISGAGKDHSKTGQKLKEIGSI